MKIRYYNNPCCLERIAVIGAVGIAIGVGMSSAMAMIRVSGMEE